MVFFFYHTKSTISSTLYFHHFSLFFSINSVKKYKKKGEKEQICFSCHKKGVILPLDWGYSQRTFATTYNSCTTRV